MIHPGARINCPLDRAGKAALDLLAHLDYKVRVKAYSWGHEVIVDDPLDDGLDAVWRVAESLRGDTTALHGWSVQHLGMVLDATWRPRVLAAVTAAWGLDEQAVAS